jgi:hypothetical protein
MGAKATSNMCDLLTINPGYLNMYFRGTNSVVYGATYVAECVMLTSGPQRHQSSKMRDLVSERGVQKPLHYRSELVLGQPVGVAWS